MEFLKRTWYIWILLGLALYFLFIQKYSYAVTCVPVQTSNPVKQQLTLWRILYDKFGPCLVV